MKNENNLVELNTILFSTLRKLEAQQIELDHAKGVANLGNTIINNAKAQLEAYKVTGGRTSMQLLPEEQIQGTAQLAQKKVKIPSNAYDRQMLYAKQIGYKTPADAIGALGKNKFLEEVELWVASNQ